MSEGNTEQAIKAFLWAEQTLDEGDILNATRDELSKLGALPPGVPTQTSSPQNVTTLTTIPDKTPIPTEISGQILHTYGVLMYIQFNAMLLNETTTRVQAAELEDPLKTNAIKQMDDFTQDVDNQIPQSVVPKSLESDWEKALTIHAQTKDILLQWKNQEIASQQVVTEIAPLLDEADTVMQDAQKIMSEEYGFDINELIQQQQEFLAYIDKLFGSSTTPTPAK